MLMLSNWSLREQSSKGLKACVVPFLNIQWVLKYVSFLHLYHIRTYGSDKNMFLCLIYTIVPKSSIYKKTC